MRLATSLAAAVGGLMLLAGPAAALPVAPAPATAGIELAAQGCGPGWARNRFGRCRPMMRPYMAPRRFYRQRCVVRQTPYGFRRVCRW